MDVSKQILEKKSLLDKLKPENEIDLVLRHLRAAEVRFRSGKKQGDPEYFTDVIYRTNQVYEGILKELYEAVSQTADEPARRKSTYEMEQLIEEAQALSPKVFQNFTSYRRDWRNPSAHDHRTDFNEHEAFTAIMNVSAFCYVTIDQILFTLNQNLAAKEVSSHLSGKGLTLDGLVSALNAQMERVLKGIPESRGNPRSRELEGLIFGIIQSLSPETALKIDQNIRVGRQSFRPDILIENGEYKAVIEVVTYPTQRRGHHVKNPFILYIQRRYEQLSRLVDDEVVNQVIFVAVPRDLESTSDRKFKYEFLEENTEEFAVIHIEEVIPLQRKRVAETRSR